MNAMVNVLQGKVLDYPLAPCQKCKTTHRFCEMHDANAVVSYGSRICTTCWNASKAKSRKKEAVARHAKRKQTELVV